MRTLIGLIRRNCLVYFRDRASVFFSMLTPLILFVLYILFLKDTFVDAFRDAAGAGVSLLTDADISLLANALLLSGILGAAFLTVSYNALELVVADRQHKVDVDALASPVPRSILLLAYFASASLITFGMVTIVGGIGIGILCVSGGISFTAAEIVKFLGIVLLGSVSASAMMLCIVLFFHKMSTCGAFMGILSAVSGFIIGAYIPLSGFSDIVRSICHLFPATAVTVWMRDLLVGKAITQAEAAFGGMDGGAFGEAVRTSFDLSSYWMGTYIDAKVSVIYVMMVLVASGIVLTVLYSKTYRKH